MKKAKHVWLVLLVTLVAIALPIGINEAYIYGQNKEFSYKTIWGAEETLGYLGDCLSFLGTVILGVITVHQTRRANDLSQMAVKHAEEANQLALQMRKMEQVHFVPLVSVTKLMIRRVRLNETKFIDRNMLIDTYIDLRLSESISERCYLVDVRIKNESAYPILQMRVHAGTKSENVAKLWGMHDADVDLYLSMGQESNLRFIIPSRFFEEKGRYDLAIRTTFTNIFDYQMPSMLYIENMECSDAELNYTYQIAKVIDIMR